MVVRRSVVAVLAVFSLVVGFTITVSPMAGATPAPTAPAAPTSLVAYRGYNSAEIVFTAGADGGAAITNYKYSTDNGSSWTAFSPAVTSPSVTVPDLTNGITYSVKLRAVNSIGDGAASDAVSVTPTTLDTVTWTTRVPAERNSWHSVAYGNGMFVAVSDTGTNRVMTSPDGVTWTARSAAEANSWQSVTYGNGQFVAVSNDGTNRVMTSPDGVTWTARSTAASYWSSVTFGNGVFVAVSYFGANRVMTSTDGVTWTVRTAVASYWSSVTFGNGVFVAVSYFGANRVMTSPDGVTWTARSAAEANGWNSVTFGNGTFVAVSSDGTNQVMTSTNGTTWTPRSTPEIDGWGSVTYGNGLFVAVSPNGGPRVMTSPDGATWTPRNAASLSLWDSVTYGNGLFVAVAGNGTAMTSPLASVGDAPTDLVATPRNGSVSVAFTAGSNGGAAITNYKYSTDNGSSWTAFSPAVTSSPVMITGLTNASTYNVKLRSVNAAGDGIASSAVSVTPRTVPSAPTSLVATPDDSSVSVAFTAGASNGTSITNYEYELNGSGSWYAFSPAVTSSPVTIAGTNGVAYTVKLRAVNSAGSGAASVASSSFTPRTVPAAPTSLVATPGSGSVSLAFTTGSNGGAAITNYKYSTDNGSTWTAFSPAVMSRSATIGGLTNGTTYSVSLRAVNAAGDGAASAAVSVTPRAVPAAPTDLVATPGDSSVSVSFTAGAANGASITNYKYSTNNGLSWTAFAPAVTSSPVTITGLSNGSSYNVKLRAVNAAGDGAESSSVSVSPRSTPSAPTSLVATPGNGSVSVSFNEGATNGAEILNYEYSNDDGSSWTAFSPSVTSSPVTITGLSNGSSYNVKLRAVNVAGDGAASSAVSVTPRTVPAAPTSLVATPGNASVLLSFTAGSNGGAAITNYKYSTDNGSTWTAFSPSVTSSPVTITGLSNSSTYNVKLRAVNAAGDGTASSAVSVSPRTVAAAPTSLVATPGNGSVSVAFTAGAANGSAITNYEYELNGSGSWYAFSPAVTSSPVTIAGTNGVAYTVKLRAVNSAGSGAASVASSSFTPRTVPAAPTDLVATPLHASVSVAFTAGSNSGAEITNYKYSTDNGSSWTAFSPAVTSSPVTITGLSNSSTYNVKLRAVNVAGDGTASSAVSVTPRAVPAAPTSLVATPGNGSVSVAFTAGAANGTSITNYEYQLNGSGSWYALSPAVTTSPVTIAGTNGVEYTVKLRAVNSAGSGAASVASSSFTPRTVPSAPTSLVANRGNKAAEIVFTAGANGGAAITNYKYQLDGGSWTAFSPAVTNPSVTVEGLTNGTTYSVKLRAVNAAGDGAISDAASVTPANVNANNWIKGTDPEENYWSSVTYGNGLFVAVSYMTGTKRVMTSPDGIAWTQHSVPENNFWYSVTYGNGLFVAVSSDGTRRVMTSPDGVIWTARSAPADAWTSVTYANGQFVAVSQSGTAMTSPDGLIWTVHAAVTNNWWSVTYGNGLFVAVSFNGTNRVMTSPDGVTWTARSAPEAKGWRSVTFGNGLFVATAIDSNKPMTSIDGINWTMGSAPGRWYEGYNALTYGNGLFVATGQNLVITSTDGVTWTTRSPAEWNVTWLSIIYGNGKFVAVAAQSFPTTRVMTAELTEVATPNAPTSLAVTSGKGSASVSFTPGADGGSAITNYEYQLNGSGPWIALSPARVWSPLTISGLTNGTAYTVKLRAVNELGAGAASVASESFTPLLGLVTPAQEGTISILAGTGSSDFPTPGTATDSALLGLNGMTVDSSGNIYISDNYSNKVFKITSDGVLSVFAGAGFYGPLTPGPADSSALSSPSGLAADAAGNIYVVTSSRQVAMITPDGTLSVVAGTGTWFDPNAHEYGGTEPVLVPGPATSVDLNSPNDVAIDSDGNLYILDSGYRQVLKVTTDGTLSVFAGNGSFDAPTEGPATSSAMGTPTGIAIDSSGNLYIADSLGGRVLQVTSGGNLSIFAGTGSTGLPTPGPAVSSTFGELTGIAADSSGNVFVTDFTNRVVAKITPDGTLTIVAGNGYQGFPTAGPVADSDLGRPFKIAVDADGNIYMLDFDYYLLEKVTFAPVPTIPAAPTDLVATPGSGSVSVAFTAGSDGGEAVTNYEYSTDGGSSWTAFSPSVTSSPVAITGLSNGSSYNITLRAVNAVGSGDASVASSSFTPRMVPAAPTDLAATPGDSSVSVSFTADFDGGAAITNYEYSTDGGSSWTAFSPAVTSSPVTITGLSNGSTYNVKLRSVNAAGDGIASSEVSVTPRTVPSAPTSLVATPDDSSVSVAFTAGAANGSEITNYEYELNGSGNWYAFSPAETSSPVTIAGTNGVAYTVKLRAVNSAGSGAASVASSSFTPRTVPAAPTSLVATPANGSVSLAFTTGSNGGAAITNYKYSTDNGSTWTAFSPAVTSSPVTITGLSNSSTYNIKLRAVNDAGDGAASSSVVFTPATAPSAPTSLAAASGDRSASLVFTAGANGGVAITKYQYRLGAGSWVDAGLTSPISITGLVNYTTYSIQVRAVNAAGGGAASVAVSARPQLTGPTIGVAYSSGKQGAQVGFAFTRPTGSTLVGFTVRAYAKGTTTVVSSCQTTPSSRGCYIPSLTSGTEYDIRVQAYFTLAGETKVRETLESSTSTVRVHN